MLCCRCKSEVNRYRIRSTRGNCQSRADFFKRVGKYTVPEWGGGVSIYLASSPRYSMFDVWVNTTAIDGLVLHTHISLFLLDVIKYHQKSLDVSIQKTVYMLGLTGVLDTQHVSMHSDTLRSASSCLLCKHTQSFSYTHTDGAVSLLSALSKQAVRKTSEPRSEQMFLRTTMTGPQGVWEVWKSAHLRFSLVRLSSFVTLPSVSCGQACLSAAVWRSLYDAWLTSFSQQTALEFSLWLFPLVLIMRWSLVIKKRTV